MVDKNSTSTYLYLIRHAQSFGNAEPIIASLKSDRGLNAIGVEQAQRLRDRLAAGEIAADVLLASTMPRALQTAQIIAPALGLPVQPDDDLQELRVGIADGMLATEAHARFGVSVATDSFTPIAPKGESWSGFTLRVAATLDRIIRQHQGKRIVAVTHGGYVAAAFIYFFGLNLLKMPPVGFAPYPSNTAITYWQSRIVAGQPIFQLITYNDDTHLRGMAVGKAINWQDLPLPPAYEYGAVAEPPAQKADQRTEGE
jgi:2,3-bisphosphoglycerate-dependent phosphoglycerate mutase